MVKGRHISKWWIIAAVPLLFVIVLVAIGLTFSQTGWQPYRVAGSSMAPSFNAGDRIMVGTHYYTNHGFADGDVIAFHHNGALIIKRIVALPGETIEGRMGVLIRNGVVLKEPYMRLSSGNHIDEENTFAPRVVPAGHLFVVGDSRDLSFDSRAQEYGPVLFSDVVGKLAFTYTHARTQSLSR